MMITRGRGNNTKRFEMPCAELVKRSPDAEQAQAKNMLCALLGISTEPAHAKAS